MVGYKHNLIQSLLYQLGRKLGYNTEIEYSISNGRIDVVWYNNHKKITFEIEASNKPALDNLNKCLAIKPSKHIHIACKTTPFNELRKELRNGKEFDLIDLRLNHDEEGLKAMIEATLEPMFKDTLTVPRKDIAEVIARERKISHGHAQRLINRMIEYGYLSLDCRTLIRLGTEV